MYPSYGGLGCEFPDRWGSLSLTVTSPVQSFVEPVTLDEVKSYLKLPYRNPPDDEEDRVLTAMIVAARVEAEVAHNKDLVRKQQDMSFDYWLSARIKLRDPLVSVESVSYRDSTNTVTTLVENTDYVVDTAKSPGIILPAYNTTWATFTAWPSSAILIRFTSGYSNDSLFWSSDIGQCIRIGIRQRVSDWFNIRLSGENAVNHSNVDALLSYGAVPKVG